MRKSLVVVVSAALLLLAYTLFHFLSVGIAMGKARTALDGGFPAVAANDLEKNRSDVVRRKDGCRLLMDTYYASRKADLLEWAAQACLASGQESPEAYLALAVSSELRGGDADALRILDAGTKKFEKTPGLYLKIAQILARNKNFDDAGNFYNQAVDKAPDNQNIALEAMQFFSQIGKDDAAKTLAGKLKGAKTDNPEIKLLLARALKRGGDVDGAKALIAEANTMMASNAQLKGRLEKIYEDVFKEGKGSGKPRVPASK
ncbi:MAG: hypothetical protein HYX41_06255 [Bdellovibrio sp.]|nr:hypothetical protein [Bdellovibrio sp.]